MPRPLVAALAALVTIGLTLIYVAMAQEMKFFVYVPLAMKEYAEATESTPTPGPLADKVTALETRVATLETQMVALSRLLTPTPTLTATPTPTPWYQILVVPMPTPIFQPGWGEGDLKVEMATSQSVDPSWWSKRKPYTKSIFSWDWPRATAYITATLTNPASHVPVEGAAVQVVVFNPLETVTCDDFAGYGCFQGGDRWLGSGYLGGSSYLQRTKFTDASGKATWSFEIDERHRGYWLYFIAIVEYQGSEWYRRLPVWVQ